MIWAYDIIIWTVYFPTTSGASAWRASATALRSISVLEVGQGNIGIFLLLLKIFMKVNNRLCVGSEMFLANPRKLFSFAIYYTFMSNIGHCYHSGR